MEEVIAAEPGDFDAGALLNEAQKVRADFLHRKGQIATLEQAGEFEKALEEIKDMIARGFTEVDGESIYDRKAQLEKKSNDFAEQKAAKYFKEAEDAFIKDNNPPLAMRFIDKALSLPWIPKTRRDAFDDLKIKVEQALEKLREVEKMVQEARVLMDQQKYEAAVPKLESALASIPIHKEAEALLKLAKQSHKDKIINETRVVIARVESELGKRDFSKLRDDLTLAESRLSNIGPEGKEWLTRSNELLGEIARREKLETTFKNAVEKAQKALDNNQLDAAQRVIDALEQKLQERPEIIAFRKELAGKQRIEVGLLEAKQAYDEGNLESALQQILVLRARAPRDREVDELYKHIQAAIYLNEGETHLKNGNLKEAGAAFKKILNLDALYLEEAREYLRQIEEQNEQDRTTRELYEAAAKHHDARRYNDAYHLLEEIEQVPSTIKNKIKTLRTSVRNKWRAQLLKQIRSCLKSTASDEILNLVDSLKKVQHAEDTPLVNEVYKYYHIHQAELAGKQKNWLKAQQSWEQAQRYDIRDERIQKGLLETRKQKALRDADAAPNETEAIRCLEEVVDRGYAELTDLDFKIEERLYEAYLLAEEFNRALGFAGTRLHREERFAAKAKTIRELCYRLSDSKEKYEVGDFPGSLDLVNDSQEKYPEYSGILQRLGQKLKKQSVDRLLNEVKDLETKGESNVCILAKCREVLHLQPKHREAKQKHDKLLENCRQNLAQTLQKALELQENPNAELVEIEKSITQTQELMSIANENDKTALQAQLGNLTRKLQTHKSLEKKIKHLEAFFKEARESGDFKTVDRELSEIANIAPQNNYAYNKKVEEIRRVREIRSKCADLASEIERAFKVLDFSNIERLVDELEKLDTEDEFFIQRRRLKFEDTYKNKIISFSDIKEWARLRRQNLEKLRGWFILNNVDTRALAAEEKMIRNDYEIDFDKRKLGQELQLLAGKYKSPIAPLSTLPELPLSDPAKQIVEQADRLKKELEEKARQLEAEARMVLQDEEKLKELVDKASALINKGDYSSARMLVEEGLKISSTHQILRHFKGVIENALHKKDTWF